MCQCVSCKNGISQFDQKIVFFPYHQGLVKPQLTHNFHITDWNCMLTLIPALPYFIGQSDYKTLTTEPHSRQIKGAEEQRENLSALLCLSAHKAVHAHEARVIPLVHCMVNMARSAPVMSQCRAVLITHSGSEDLCQSLGAHFTAPQQPHSFSTFTSSFAHSALQPF